MQGDAEKQSECDRLCPEDAVVFILLPAYSVISSSHTHTHICTCTHTNSLALFLSSSLSYTTCHSPEWEESCAAAAILNDIGQWEIVYAVKWRLVYVMNKRLTKVKNTCVITNTQSDAMCSCCYWEQQINQTTSWCKPTAIHMQMNHVHTNNKPIFDTWFISSKGNITQKTEVTEQVSRTSCDKDTIESGEKEEKQDLVIHVHSWLLCVSLSWTDQHWQLGCQSIT